MGVKHGSSQQNWKKEYKPLNFVVFRRRILIVPYTEHRTNVSIREEITSIIGLHDPLLTVVKKRKMQFYGHTNRAGNLATTILQGSVDGKRGRGRPRTTWLKNIVDWTGLAIND